MNHYDGSPFCLHRRTATTFPGEGGGGYKIGYSVHVPLAPTKRAYIC